MPGMKSDALKDTPEMEKVHFDYPLVFVFVELLPRRGAWNTHRQTPQNNQAMKAIEDFDELADQIEEELEEV